jgi:hypothetical protein
MNRQPHIGIRRPRAGYALTPRQMGFWATPACHPAREPLRFWPRHPRTATIGLLRRLGAGISAPYKFHSQGMHHSVHG